MTDRPEPDPPDLDRIDVDRLEYDRLEYERRDLGPPELGDAAPVATVELPVVAAPTGAPRTLPNTHPWRRRAIRAAVAIAVAMVAYYGITVLQVWSTGRASEARAVDAFVVLGAAQYDGRPSPQLRGRLDEVVRLWPEGHASVVVVTGGNRPGDRFTEAEASARYLIDQGIPESAIVLENEGRTTFESLESTAEILGARGLDRVLLVTDPFHALRSKLIAREVGMEAYVAPTSTTVVVGARSGVLHLREAGGVAIGRIIGFERLSGLAG